MKPRPSCVLLAACLAWSATAQAYTIAPDGDPVDWLLSAPADVNTGHIARDFTGIGEYVWLDAEGDERTDFATPDGRVDMVEVRTTSDGFFLYFFNSISS